MTEDEIYRSSTQYRLWSFTSESLASLRSTTNSLAIEGVKAAIQSKREEAQQRGDGDGRKNPIEFQEVNGLTVEEERKLVDFYCLKTIDFAAFCEFPTNVMVLLTIRLPPSIKLTHLDRLQQCNI